MIKSHTTFIESSSLELLMLHFHRHLVSFGESSGLENLIIFIKDINNLRKRGFKSFYIVYTPSVFNELDGLPCKLQLFSQQPHKFDIDYVNSIVYHINCLSRNYTLKNHVL